MQQSYGCLPELQVEEDEWPEVAVPQRLLCRATWVVFLRSGGAHGGRFPRYAHGFAARAGGGVARRA